MSLKQLVGLEIKNPLDCLKRVLKYVEFIQYIFTSLEGKFENDDDVLE